MTLYTKAHYRADHFPFNKKIAFSSVPFNPLTDWVVGGGGGEGAKDNSTEISSSVFCRKPL